MVTCSTYNEAEHYPEYAKGTFSQWVVVGDLFFRLDIRFRLEFCPRSVQAILVLCRALGGRVWDSSRAVCTSEKLAHRTYVFEGGGNNGSNFNRGDDFVLCPLCGTSVASFGSGGDSNCHFSISDRAILGGIGV